MAKFEGVSKVISTFRQKGRDGRARDAKMSVGYTAPYALYVHENRGANFKVGRAGFLSDVAREMAGELARIASRQLRAGATMVQRLTAMGAALLAESKRNCPVDTGYLRSTGYVRIDEVK